MTCPEHAVVAQALKSAMGFDKWVQREDPEALRPRRGPQPKSRR